jgi:acetate kinase
VRVLVVNAGSSSLKLRVVDDRDATVAAADLPAVADLAPGDLAAALDGLGPCDAAGHRVVHGGQEFTVPVVVGDGVRDRIAALGALAPLHQPASVEALDAVTRALPHLPAVACFDTAFHATLPAPAATYAVPLDWRRRLHVRRYGFHGLSHAYASRRAAELLGAAASARVVTCHLGAGASLTAVLDGRSVDTTMGFTPLEGLVMATRSGNVDPGLLLWLLEHEEVDTASLQQALEHESGMLGLAGTADMREALLRDDPEARLAVDVYIHRLRASIAAMTASLGGLDALVFTGGVGENAPAIRALATEGLDYLGVSLDAAANESARPDADVSAAGAAARTLVIAAREDLEIARQVREVLGA